VAKSETVDPVSAHTGYGVPASVVDQQLAQSADSVLWGVEDGESAVRFLVDLILPGVARVLIGSLDCCGHRRV
jgi:hypothetical protein